jgi:class 3 adenylate cyclase/tetratricopeptide (TPR) repeat protein
MLTCPSCGKDNPEGFAFCGHCGAELREPTPELLEERKVVSILFCDLVGFTAASERQDPEDVRARLRSYHARLRHEIERYGGTVEKFVGDAVMAAFGAPASHEDDAERAVRAGLGILDAIAGLNAAEPELDLKVRVGINTGEAVVAVGARPERGEGLVAGDVVNTAARIQAAAPVNGVAVSEHTYRTTSHIFEYEPLDLVSVKGKVEPLVLWEAKAIRIRFGTDFHEHATPFVGRELEKPLLIGIFERAMQRRSVQLVTVVGEPGVGKSRMIAELFAYMHAKVEIVRWRQGRCLPYGEGITFWALGEIVKREAAILESDSADVALQKLEAALSPDTPERQWLIQRLAPLVGVETGAPAERQESFTAWRRYLEGLAAGRETVLVFEDLHWGDEALLDFIEHLAEWAEDVPLLIICSARPELYERRPGWAAGQRNAHTINLAPLSDEETAELVSSLIAATLLTPELEHAILEQAGGNPLYAEEFVRLLADRGLAAGEMTLPETVQALIAARLDTLPPERKSLLQDAAVIGKVFWASAVAEMGGLDQGEVEVALHELARKELVRPARTSSMEGESEYSFWHLLVRDVAYGQIPRAQRSRRHRAAAEWIERKAGERVEDLAEVLAHHYVQALELAEAAGDAAEAEELAAPARRFLALAGERALGLDTAQAEARLARALDLTPIEDPERLRLVTRWADAALQAGRMREAVEMLDKALTLLATNADTETVAEALQLRSRVSTRLAEGRGVELAAEAVNLLEHEGRHTALVAGYAQLANAHWINGSYADAIDAADHACALAEQLGLPEPPRALGYRGMARAYAGDPGGLAEMERALDAFVNTSAGREISVLQNNLAVARYPLEGPARSLSAFEAAIAFCEQRGLREAERLLATNRPGLLAELGRTDEALADAESLAAMLEASGQIADLVEVRGVELAVQQACGRKPERVRVDWLLETARGISHIDISTYGRVVAAVALAHEAPADARAVLAELDEIPGSERSPYFARYLASTIRAALTARDRPLATRLIQKLKPRYPLDEHARCAAHAALAEHAGDHEEAAALYAEAASRWQEFGNVPERAYALLGQGRCLRALGRPGAEEPLLEARDLFASMGYRPALAETDALLQRTATAAARSSAGD